MPHASTTTNPDVTVPAPFGGTLVCRMTLDDREPIVALHHLDSGGTQCETFAVPSRAEQVHIALPSGSIRCIDALDILEHTLDEQAMLAEFARLLVPDGILRLRVPVDGPASWLDALNIARYVSELTGMIPDPDEPQPMGWHRHYRPCDLMRLVSDAGFTIETTARVNPGLLEIPHAAGLIGGQTLLRRSGTERSLFRLRQRLSAIENTIPAGALGTRITMTARRAR